MPVFPQSIASESTKPERSSSVVVGGTGYLGRYIVDSLLRAGHRVTVVSRSVKRAKAMLGGKVRVVEGDIDSMSARDWETVFKNQDNLAFAAGIDERIPPVGDPATFYQRENVDKVEPILKAAGECGIKRVVLLNSIFSTLDRLRPEIGLARSHSYIASRVAQRDMALSLAKGRFIMTVLEIPWVFGDARGGDSQWGPLIQYVRTTPRIFAPRGGTVVISARNVGEAALGALTLPKRSSAVPVGDIWMSWDELLSQLAVCCEREPLKVQRVPDNVLVQFNEIGGFWQKLFWLKSGLDYGKIHQFLLDDQPINLRASQRKLGYRPDRIARSLCESAADVPESRAIKAARQLLRV
jgi:dihydroflavonol-4-reductase